MKEINLPEDLTMNLESLYESIEIKAYNAMSLAARQHNISLLIASDAMEKIFPHNFPGRMRLLEHKLLLLRCTTKMLQREAGSGIG
jgi:hypothetical protein